MERLALARRLLLFLGLAGLVGLRLLHLSADTPIGIGTGSVGVFVDEGYKTLDARNLVERGATRWHAADGYSGWADNSPLGHTGFVLAFRLADPSLESARLVTLVWTAVLLAAWLVATDRRPWQVAAVGLVLLGLQHTLFFFSRIALLELPLIVLLYGALLPLIDGRRSLRGAALWASTCALVAGIGLKPSAVLYFVPVWGGLVVAAWLRSRQPSRSRMMLAAATLVLPLAWGLLHRGALDGRLALPHLADLRLVLLNPLSFASGGLLAAGLIGLAWALVHDPRGFLASPYRAALAWIALTGPWLFAPFPYAPLRYHVPLLPAFALLAIEAWRFRPAVTTPRESPRWAAGLALGAVVWGLIYLGHTLDQQLLRRLPVDFLNPAVRSEAEIRLLIFVLPAALAVGVLVWRGLRGWSARSASRVIGGLLIASLVVDGWHLGHFLFRPQYQVREISEAIDRHLDERLTEDASLAGDWAPLFTLGTGRPALYLAAPDNAPERLGDLRPDAFLYSDTLDGRLARSLLSAGIDGLHLGPALYTAQYAGRDVVLYTVIEDRP